MKTAILFILVSAAIGGMFLVQYLIKVLPGPLRLLPILALAIPAIYLILSGLGVFDGYCGRSHDGHKGLIARYKDELRIRRNLSKD